MKFTLISLLLLICINSFSQTNPTLFQDKKTNLWGYSSKLNGKETVVIPAKFSNAYKFEKNCAIVTNGQKYGLINTKGDLILDTIYIKISMLDHRIYQLFSKDFTGIADTNGKIIVPVKYTRISINNVSNRFIITEDSVQRLLNYQGETVLELANGTIDFDYIYVFLNKNKLNAVANLNGKIIFDFQKAEFEPNGNLIKIKKNRRIGYGNEFGQIIIPIEYSFGTKMVNNRFIIYDGKKYAYFDEKGKQLTEFIYDIAYGFSSDFALIMRDGKRGFIDREGKEIAWGYDDADMPDGYITRVMKNSQWGYINSTGVEIVPLAFDSASPINGNFPLSYVKKNNKWGILNFAEDNLNTKPKLEYDSIVEDDVLLSEWYSVVCYKNNKAGMIEYDQDFQTVSERYLFEFDSLVYLNNFYYNEMGEIIIKACGNGFVNLYDQNQKRLNKHSFLAVYEAFSANQYLVRIIVKSKENKFGVIDGYGKEKIKIDYDTIISREDLMYDGEISALEVRKNGKCGLFDFEGRAIVPILYDSIVKKPDNISMDLVLFCYGKDLIQIYDYEMQAILPSKSQEVIFEYPTADFMSEGWLKVKKGGFYGIYSMFERTWLIKNYYDDVQVILENQAVLVKANGKFGIYSMDSRQLKYNCIYDDFFYGEDEYGTKIPKLKLGSEEVNIVLYE